MILGLGPHTWSALLQHTVMVKRNMVLTTCHGRCYCPFGALLCQFYSRRRSSARHGTSFGKIRALLESLDRPQQNVESQLRLAPALFFLNPLKCAMGYIALCGT